MALIRDGMMEKQWATVFEAIDMPLESVPVKPWYGKKVDILDLTQDDKDEDLAPAPAPAPVSVTAMFQNDGNIEEVVKEVSMGMPDIKAETGEAAIVKAEAREAAILKAELQVRSMFLSILHILLLAKVPRTRRLSLEHRPGLSSANRPLDSQKLSDLAFLGCLLHMVQEMRRLSYAPRKFYYPLY